MSSLDYIKAAFLAAFLTAQLIWLDVFEEMEDIL